MLLLLIFRDSFHWNYMLSLTLLLMMLMMLLMLMLLMLMLLRLITGGLFWRSFCLFLFDSDSDDVDSGCRAMRHVVNSGHTPGVKNILADRVEASVPMKARCPC